MVDGGLNLVGILRAPASGDAELTVAGDIQGSGLTGWSFAGETWTYVSATTFTVSGDQTAKYTKGTKLKLTQTTAKYFYVVASVYVLNTTVSVTGGSDYTLANAAITSPFFSYADVAQGFPDWFAYTPTGIAASNVTLSGRFCVHGKHCFVDFKALFSGAITFTTQPTLPITASASINSASIINMAGIGGYEDSGTAFVLGSIWPTIVASATTFTIRTAAAAAMSATVPITWANNDTLEAHFGYEI